EHPRSTHLKPGNGNGGSNGVTTPPPRGDSNGNGNGHSKPNGNGNGNGASAAVLPPRGSYTPAAASTEKIRAARAKGYEGDPCSRCQALMLVRSGACMRCDNCGETTGCG